MGLNTTASAVGLCVALALAACVKPLDLPDTDFSAPFVDGALVVDSVRQSLRLARTNGLAERATPIPNATIEVADLTTSEVYAYDESPAQSGRYVASFTPQFEHAYRLTVAIPGIGTYQSRADSLMAHPISLAGEARVRARLDRAGLAQETNAAGAQLSVRNEGEAAVAGVLTLRPFFVWSYSDAICAWWDIREKCYFVEDEPTDPFAVVDLSLISPGDTAGLTLGSAAIDFRLAEEAFFVTRVRRYSPAATPYYLAVAQALNPTGTPLDERPRPAVGNMLSEAGAPTMLGFFGVTASTLVVAGTPGVRPIVSRAGIPLCARTREPPAEFDCCFCETSEGATTERPAYLP